MWYPCIPLFIVIHWSSCLCSSSAIKSDSTTSNVIEQCKTSAHHILTAIRNKNQNRLQKGEEITACWINFYIVMRSWISAYMKLSGSEDAVHCGDKERRNDDHAFWLEAAETRENPARMEAMLPLCPPPSSAMKNPSALQHITVWSLWSCAVFTGGGEQGNYYQQTETDEINKYYCIHITRWI